MILIVQKGLRTLRFTAIAFHVLIISLAKSSRTILWFMKSVEGNLFRWLTYTKPPILCTRPLVRTPHPLSLLHNAMLSCVISPPSSRPRTDTQPTSASISEGHLNPAESLTLVDPNTLLFMLAYDTDHVYVRPTTSDNDCIPACALEAEEPAPLAYSHHGSNMRPNDPLHIRKDSI